MGRQCHAGPEHTAKDDTFRFGVRRRNAPFHMAGVTSNPVVGIVDELFIVRRMALAAVDRNDLLMVLLVRLGVTAQAFNASVQGQCMIIRHFFMAFRALGIGVTITGIDLCRRRRWASD